MPSGPVILAANRAPIQLVVITVFGEMNPVVDVTLLVCKQHEPVFVRDLPTPPKVVQTSFSG